jgi:AAA ATPase domain
MARLTSVAIRRFKRIEQIEIPLDVVTLLIGANNSGKSSILQAIHFAVSIAQTARLVGEGVAWRQDKFELSFNPSQLLYSPVADVLSLATGGMLLEPRASQIEIEFRAEGGISTVIGLRRGRNRNIGVSIAGRVIGEKLMHLPQPFTVLRTWPCWRTQGRKVHVTRRGASHRRQRRCKPHAPKRPQDVE